MIIWHQLSHLSHQCMGILILKNHACNLLCAYRCDTYVHHHQKQHITSCLYLYTYSFCSSFIYLSIPIRYVVDSVMTLLLQLDGEKAVTSIAPSWRVSLSHTAHKVRMDDGEIIKLINIKSWPQSQLLYVLYREFSYHDTWFLLCSGLSGPLSDTCPDNWNHPDNENGSTST